MKKIGICTLYYQNRNYGANLQAYALQRVISSMGYDVEMISYYNNTRLHYLLSSIKQKIFRKGKISDGIKKRYLEIDDFNKSIPHSKLYYSNTIDKANNNYNCFITGSDQVWNPNWINRYMSLEFTNEKALTIAYAASTGKIVLDQSQQQKLKIALDHTKFISIREKESISSLEELTNKKITYVLDPTMLLSRGEWDKICSNRIVNENYLFCYFLGDNKNIREVAQKYAEKKGLKIVTLPYLNSNYREVDDSFGDYPLFKISPNDFLSLVRHASFVMTDSFHAAVFAHIYDRPFVVSGKKNEQMGCRMKSLVDLFGTTERYIIDHNMVTVENLCDLESKRFNVNRENYELMKEKSLHYLKEVLKDE